MFQGDQECGVSKHKACCMMSVVVCGVLLRVVRISLGFLINVLDVIFVCVDIIIYSVKAV